MNTTIKKYCGTCACWKEVQLFSTSSYTHDGYRSYCKQCKNAKDREARKFKKLGIKKEKSDNQRRKTNKVLYGCDHPMQSEKIKNKHITTIKSLYGVDNYSKTKQFLSKKAETSIKKYGVDNYFKHPDFQIKRNITINKKYNKQLPNLLDKWVLPNGLPLVTYCKTYNKNISYCRYLFEIHGLSVLQDWVEFDKRPNKNNLEKHCEALIQIPYYGNKSLTRYPDFKLTDQVYLDVDGLYWHSSAVKEDTNYHFNKRKEYENANLRLIQFREDEVYKKPEIVKGMVDNLLNKNINNIFARKCIIKEMSWDESKIFYLENHLQGSGTTSKSVGLYYDGILVCSMSYRFKSIKENTIEISRFATKIRHRVVGSFSKLIKYIINLVKPSLIYSWCDLRYSQGKVYETNGFTIVKETLGWCWTDFESTFNRLKCKAIKGKSETEVSKTLGWTKLYDAGQRLYKLNL